MATIQRVYDPSVQPLYTREVADDGRVFFIQPAANVSPSTFTFEAMGVLTGSITVAKRLDKRGHMRWTLCRDADDQYALMHDLHTGGKHQLFIPTTSAQRLAAHWRGFVLEGSL